MTLSKTAVLLCRMSLMLSVANKTIMMSIVMLNVVVLSVVMLSVVMLSVNMLSVGMLNVVVLSVVAPQLEFKKAVWVGSRNKRGHNFKMEMIEGKNKELE
jgi:hypothetical protein